MTSAPPPFPPAPPLPNSRPPAPPEPPEDLPPPGPPAPPLPNRPAAPPAPPGWSSDSPLPPAPPLPNSSPPAWPSSPGAPSAPSQINPHETAVSPANAILGVRVWVAPSRCANPAAGAQPCPTGNSQSSPAISGTGLRGTSADPTSIAEPVAAAGTGAASPAHTRAAAINNTHAPGMPDTSNFVMDDPYLPQREHNCWQMYNAAKPNTRLSPTLTQLRRGASQVPVPGCHGFAMGN